jgi:hypothetical protein
MIGAARIEDDRRDSTLCNEDIRIDDAAVS